MHKLNWSMLTTSRRLSTAYQVLKMCRDKPIIKARANAQELFRKRVEKGNKKKKNIILNQADLHIIGSNCQGFRPSLLVTSEGKSYMFNCGEGTQRFCYSNKIRLTHLGNLFITNHDWDNIGGALGLSLTVQSVGQTSFTVHSSDRVTGLFDSISTFTTFTSGMKCTTQSHLDGVFEDKSIRIEPIPIVTRHIEANSGLNATSKKIKTDVKLLAYVCKLPDLPGPLDSTKCREFNVPVGPLLGVLKWGGDVTLKDGTVVKSSDVCGSSDRGLIFVVVEAPTADDIQSFKDNAKLNEHISARGAAAIDMVFHFSPEDVINHHDYQDWLNSFPDQCKHVIMMNNDYKRANFIDCYRLQYLLRQLDATMFPPLYLPESLAEEAQDEINRTVGNDNNPLDYGLGELDEIESKTRPLGKINELDRIIKAKTLDRFVVRPSNVLEFVESHMGIDYLHRAAKIDPNYKETLAGYKNSLLAMPLHKDYEPEVVFLGTGSALPSKIRNTSGILINFQEPRNASIIMDCGEDTYGQLLRFYGPDGADKVLKRLKMIYVSHHHADHHLGLLKLIRKRQKVCNEPVLLLLPTGLDNLLTYHNENVEDLSACYTIYNTRSLRTRPTDPEFVSGPLQVLKPHLCKKLNGLLNDFAIVGVDHCVNACAVMFDFNIGTRGMESFKIAYSGDARPSDDFVMAAKNCDLLIHEATFDHFDQEEALCKKHCTSSEAILVAKKMQAKFTILTHFSQKLPKIPYFTKDFDDKIGFAFDNMAIRCPSHFKRIPIMKDVLKLIFSKSLQEIQSKHYRQDAKKIIMEKIIENSYSNSNQA